MCLGTGQAGLIILLSAAATVGVILMLACQMGFCLNEQQVPIGDRLIAGRERDQMALNFGPKRSQVLQSRA